MAICYWKIWFFIKDHPIPAGIPAFCANAAIAKADSGVSSAGFITQVHPHASAAAAYFSLQGIQLIL